MDKKFESLNHEWSLQYDDNVLENWNAEQSVKLMIDASEVAEVYGLDNFGCLDEDDEDYPKIKEDMQFVSRLLVGSKDMYLFIKRIAEGVYTPWQLDAQKMLDKLNQPKVN